MKYFIDTEFIEGTQAIRVPFTNLIVGQTKPTIDLISIGIVAEDGREYYAISKDFNLKEAWNRFDLKQYSGDRRNQGDGEYKDYWIRENVLKPIFVELLTKEYIDNGKYTSVGNHKMFTSAIIEDAWKNTEIKNNYKVLKKLINKYGKTNKQIAEEVKEFTYVNLNYIDYKNINSNIQFYGYYSAYDWVAFCWLFGKMIDLPNGFPKYCIDLKQEMDRILIKKNLPLRGVFVNPNKNLDTKLKEIKSYKNYPEQTNNHHALSDAKWNYELYKFLQQL